jgi:tetratricopeptide (TPR) repeat protein
LNKERVMNRLQLALGVCGLLAAAALVAAPDQPYIVSRDGRTLKVASITATADGSIEFVDLKGQKVTWRSGQFRGAYVPEPQEVKTLEGLLEKKDYDNIIKYAPVLRQRFGILGWGDKICYLEGTAHLEKGDAVKASEVFTAGLRYPGKYRDDLARGRVVSMIAQGKVDQVRDALDAMVRSPREADAAMALNARGQILAKEGKSREAVLEYLKTLLLFEDSKSVKPYRDEAREQVVALMRKMGDPKWKMFVDLD